MKVLHLPKLPNGTVDYYALQAYHAAAAHDRRRSREKRSWHRLQATIIASKLRGFDWNLFCARFRGPLFNLRKKS